MPPRTPFVLLEDRLSAEGGAQLFADPVRIITASDVGEVAAALGAVEAALAEGHFLAGFLSYELGYAFEPRLLGLMPEERPLPLLWFGCFREPARLDPAELDTAFAALPAPPPITAIRPGLGAEAHARNLQAVHGFLRAGDVYQVNLTFPLHFRFAGDPLALYAAMRAAQPAAHGGIVATGGATLLSVSPELFVETNRGRATTRPMKGTTARGATPRADAEAARVLLADPKQRAENLMIVDLLRNDLSRVSEVGSVAVPHLFSVESYPTLHTLTSTVTGRLRPEVTAPDLLRAMFPCGSVTGAPKIRAMEIIRGLETAARGAYTGSMGMIAPDGDLRFNVAIRTATLLPGGEGVYGVGGGIVVDSDPAAEYAECLLKARVLTDLATDFGLIETFRWTPAEGFLRLDLHLSRLGRSARELDFAFDDAAARRQLQDLAAGFGEDGDRRVRIELARTGRLALTAAALGPEAAGLLRVGIAAARIDPGDPFVRHKTTRRDIYEQAFALAAGDGLDEAVLLNRHGFVAETARGSIFVERDGVLLTPPLAHGLLPGVLRQSLLREGRAREAALRPDDLRGVWYVGNSLRGLRPACLASPPPGAETVF